MCNAGSEPLVRASPVATVAAVTTVLSNIMQQLSFRHHDDCFQGRRCMTQSS